MKVSFYILQKNEEGDTRLLPFLTDLNFHSLIQKGTNIFLSDVEFTIYQLQINGKCIKAYCKMVNVDDYPFMDRLLFCYISNLHLL